MNLGVQYYRPPFPNDRYWADDMARIAASGLNTVQLWVIWGWVESKPGGFCFDDYDKLVELAHKHGLGVILSTIAEVQPYWIHREVPGSEMIDHMGHTVVSSNRSECHFGITPGGCTDHPGVWERMQNFLTQVVTRYRSAPALRGWDAWNELRWNVQADGLVCYCEHTIDAYHRWLDARYGGLDGLNRAWQRRYGAWDEVFPGKLPDRPYTELMAFQHFLTARANAHGLARYKLMKPLDPERPVTVHAAHPCPLLTGGRNDHAINRGNDWHYADGLDGVGCSSFPKWAELDDAAFGMRVEFVKSAAGNKRVWLSEVQGGRSAVGFNVYERVDALSQQRWIWNGLACGADTILFWCWRDEVFGRESAGFGLIGDDGLAEERLAAMRVTGSVVKEQRDLLATYQPTPPEVGVLFSPQTYYLHWAQEGHANRAMAALTGYCRGLIKRSIPYRVVEEEHLGALEGLKVLFMPRTLVVDDDTAAALRRFVEGGGTLVCESECGAFDSAGLYRYPVDRFTAAMAGVHEIGRRSLDADGFTARVCTGDSERELSLGAVQWYTPWQPTGDVWASHEDGALLMEVPVGKGRLALCGAYLGEAYDASWSPDFEDLLEAITRRAGCVPDAAVMAGPGAAAGSDDFVYVKTGRAGGRAAAFVFFPKGADSASVRFRHGFFASGAARDLMTSEKVALADGVDGQACTITAGDWRFRVLLED